MLERVRNGYQWMKRHRTKVLGMAAVAVGYCQNNLAQLGHLLSPQWQGRILMAFGVAAFFIGLYNTFAPSDPP